MLLNKAKKLRKTMTNPEQRLWYFLRNHRFMGIKFKRQKALGPYIVDFIAIREKLIIELDGGQHAESRIYDAKRTNYLNGLGFEVLRFWNNECLFQIEGVLSRIFQTLSE